MKYKVGDKVRVKSLEWYNKNKDKYGDVHVPFGFIKDMVQYCGKEFTVTSILDYSDGYLLSNTSYTFSDEMLEDATPVLEIPAGYEVDKIESGKIYLKKLEVTTYDTIELTPGYEISNKFRSEQEAKSATAMAQISQLIPYYGGTITNEEWADNSMPKYVLSNYDNTILYSTTNRSRNFIAFHTEKQRKTFMSYPENVQLVKDYLMIE